MKNKSLNKSQRKEQRGSSYPVRYINDNSSCTYKWQLQTVMYG